MDPDDVGEARNRKELHHAAGHSWDAAPTLAQGTGICSCFPKVITDGYDLTSSGGASNGVGSVLSTKNGLNNHPSQSKSPGAANESQ
jgi:hypothetical protein